jgi:hypothetical protein
LWALQFPVAIYCWIGKCQLTCPVATINLAG